MSSLMTKVISVEVLSKKIKRTRTDGKKIKVPTISFVVLVAFLTLPFGWFVLPRFLGQTTSTATDLSYDSLHAIAGENRNEFRQPHMSENEATKLEAFCRRQCKRLSREDSLPEDWSIDDCYQDLCKNKTGEVSFNFGWKSGQRSHVSVRFDATTTDAAGREKHRSGSGTYDLVTTEEGDNLYIKTRDRHIDTIQPDGDIQASFWVMEGQILPDIFVNKQGELIRVANSKISQQDTIEAGREYVPSIPESTFTKIGALDFMVIESGRRLQWKLLVEDWAGKSFALNKAYRSRGQIWAGGLGASIDSDVITKLSGPMECSSHAPEKSCMEISTEYSTDPNAMKRALGNKSNSKVISISKITKHRMTLEPKTLVPHLILINEETRIRSRFSFGEGETLLNTRTKISFRHSSLN